MLDEPRDISVAIESCRWAERKLKQDDYLVKANMCGQSKFCRRALDINAVCKTSGPEADTRQFHSRLLAQFASNVQCQIAIVRLTERKSDSDSRKNLEIFKQATWDLNLNFTPGAAKQGWALWPYQSGSIVGSALEGEGDPRQIATDVCTIVAGRGAKIRN